MCDGTVWWETVTRVHWVNQGQGKALVALARLQEILPKLEYCYSMAEHIGDVAHTSKACRQLSLVYQVPGFFPSFAISFYSCQCQVVLKERRRREIWKKELEERVGVPCKRVLHSLERVLHSLDSRETCIHLTCIHLTCIHFDLHSL